MRKIITTLITLFVLTNTIYAQESAVQESASKEIKEAIANKFTDWLKKSDFETNIEYEKRVKTKSEEELKKITEIAIKEIKSIYMSEILCYSDNYNAENSTFQIELSPSLNYEYNRKNYSNCYTKLSQFLFLKVNPRIAEEISRDYINEATIIPLDVEINENDEWKITKAYILFGEEWQGNYDLDSNLKLINTENKIKELDLKTIIKIKNSPNDEYLYYTKWDIKTQPNFTPSQSKPIAFSLEDLNITLPATLISSSSSAVTKSEEPDLDSKMIQTTNRNPNAVAVVIGNKEYENTKKVSYATNDAAEVKNYLIKALGYSESNIIYIENAKKSNFDILFGTNDNPEGKLFNSIKQGESDVFIYYSGHGAPGLKDNKGYIVPVDCDPNYLEQTGYSLDLFYKNLAKLNAKSVSVVTDACFSGAELFKNISPITITVSNPIVLMPNCVVLSSSTGSQVSSWFNEKNHGLFTYFFLRAFQEKEKVDADKNNTITFRELANYIADKTQGVPSLARKLHNVDQNPTIQGTGVENVFLSY